MHDYMQDTLDVGVTRFHHKRAGEAKLSKQ
jgi:hypothetical protein